LLPYERDLLGNGRKKKSESDCEENALEIIKSRRRETYRRVHGGSLALRELGGGKKGGEKE